MNDANAETRVALPSLMTWGTQPMLTLREVKGAATEASAVDNEIPVDIVEIKVSQKGKKG